MVGSDSGAMMPILGVATEGSVVRVIDAYVIVYRTIVHNALVAITTDEIGESTADLNYNINDWWHWYNDEYVPYKNEQILLEHLSK